MFKDVHSKKFGGKVLNIHQLGKDNKYMFILETLETKEKHKNLSLVKFKVDFQNRCV